MNETMIAAPSTTIWGRVQHREKLANGVYSVGTARHGGVVVHHLVADKYISDKAKAIIGERDGAWYSFEEDCVVDLFAYENPDIIPERWKQYDFQEGVQRWFPEYFTMTAQQIIDKHEAERKAAREAAERAVEEGRKCDAFRRELLDHDWTKGDKLYQCDGYTVSIGKPDSAAHEYPCTFNVKGEERVIMMRFDTIYTILTSEKKNN